MSCTDDARKACENTLKAMHNRFIPELVRLGIIPNGEQATSIWNNLTRESVDEGMTTIYDWTQ